MISWGAVTEQMDIPAGSKIAPNGRKNIVSRLSSVNGPFDIARLCTYDFFDDRASFGGAVVPTSKQRWRVRSNAVSITSQLIVVRRHRCYYCNLYDVPGNVKMTTRVLNP